VALGLAAAFVATVASAGDEVKITPQQAKALGIQTTPLTAGAAGTHGLPGQVVVPNNQLRIVSAPLAGLVQSTLAAVNQTVKKGEPLVRLQSPALIEAQREFLQASVQGQLARATATRDESLFKEGIIAESRYLAAKGNYAQAAAAASERRQALRLYGMSDGAINRLQAGQALSDTVELVSPIDGVVLEQTAVAGQRAEASAPLYKIGKLSPLWLEIQAPVSVAAGLHEGGAVKIPAYSATGKVVSVGRSVAPGSQTVMVRAEVTEGAQNLRVGQFVEAQVTGAATGAKEWRIPNAALVRSQGKAYVFVQIPGGFRATAVTVVSETADGAVIKGALQGNEQIAIAGLAGLKGSWMGLGGAE
jgi:RND family efflux transporter MFP subunit